MPDMSDPLERQRLLANPHRWLRDPAFCCLALSQWEMYLRTPQNVNKHVRLMVDALEVDIDSGQSLHRGHWIREAAHRLAKGTHPAAAVLDEDNAGRLLVWIASR